MTNLNNHRLAITFSRPVTSDPLLSMGEKRPVYEELISRLELKKIKTYITTTNKYLMHGIFKGFWEYKKDERCKFINQKINADLVYDRSAGLDFPKIGDDLKVVDSRDFKILAWNKWLAYRNIGNYMAKTYLISDNLPLLLKKIRTDLVVIKPVNGLKGKDLFIGNKAAAKEYKMNRKRSYILCEYIDTSKGIKGIVGGVHDLRVVIINKNIVWSHVRTPPEGSLKSNVAQGGNLTEVDINELPENVINIAGELADRFFKDFDNPVYSLDFGIDNKGKAYIFEINDTIGFPKPTMLAKNRFLDELIKNFESKL